MDTIVAAPVATCESDRIPRIAVKWGALGLTSLQSPPSTSGPTTNNFPINAGNIGLEYRFANGYWALRSDYEYGIYGGAWDFLSMKLSLFKNSFLRPFLSAGVTGSNIYDHNLTTGIVTKTGTLSEQHCLPYKTIPPGPGVAPIPYSPGSAAFPANYSSCILGQI